MRIGIDLGGTKIAIIAIDDDGSVLHKARTPTPRNDYKGTLAAIRRLVANAEAETGQVGTVGIAIPGTISPATGVVKNANSTWIIGRPFDTDCATALDRPVRVVNDANCFALSEAIDGAAAGYDVVFGVIIGTGCGGGLVVRSEVHTGPNAIAGEWGHNPLPWPTGDEVPGPACYCGKRGCIETFVSGTGLARDHYETTGTPLAPPAIAQRAADGDGAAEATLARYDDRLARALAGVINTLDPDAIVLGGGLSNLTHLYTMIPSLWSDYIFSDEVATPLLAPKHGDDSGVRGAAWLWPVEQDQ